MHLLSTFNLHIYGAEADLATLGWAQKVTPDIAADGALRLELKGEPDDSQQLAAITILATELCYIWEARVMKKKVKMYEVRAELEAMVSLMRRTRHRESGDTIWEAINQ